jgi:uncharacterized MnhB-related membrane protein
MEYVLIAGGILVCAIEAIRSTRLLVSAIWLAVTSALVALMMYLLGAAEVAVIELSVGAGLVTVLFVFAINIAGEEMLHADEILPRSLSLFLIFLSVGLLTWFSLPNMNLPEIISPTTQLASALWYGRSLDVVLQIVLIFSGVLGVIGLLGDEKPHWKEKSK